jgi:hypothetical protein
MSSPRRSPPQCSASSSRCGDPRYRHANGSDDRVTRECPLRGSLALLSLRDAVPRSNHNGGARRCVYQRRGREQDRLLPDCRLRASAGGARGSLHLGDELGNPHLHRSSLAEAVENRYAQPLRQTPKGLVNTSSFWSFSEAWLVGSVPARREGVTVLWADLLGGYLDGDDFRRRRWATGGRRATRAARRRRTSSAERGDSPCVLSTVAGVSSRWSRDSCARRRGRAASCMRSDRRRAPADRRGP